MNDDALVNAKNDFFEKLHLEITKIDKTRQIIILGNLNSRTGKKQHNKVIGQYGEDFVNDNGMRLITLCEQNEMKITNGYYFQHRDVYKYTWTQNTRGLKSIIDYTIVRQTSKIKVQDVRVYRGGTCGSDHNLLKANITFGIHKSEEIKEENELEKISGEKYNLNSLEQESVRELYRKRPDQKREDKEFNNNEEHYHHIKMCLHEAATETLGYLIKTNKKQPYWWDAEIEQEIEDKRRKYQKFVNTKDNTDKIVYKEAQAKVRRMICQKKNQAWQQKCNMINTHLGGRKSTESWKLLKSRRQERGKT